MSAVDVELVLVGLVAMLEPATLICSALALVIGDRPLRTGAWFYLAGLGATLAVGVLAAVLIGELAAAPGSKPKTWVAILNVVLGAALLAYVAWTTRRPEDPDEALDRDRDEQARDYRPSPELNAGLPPPRGARALGARSLRPGLPRRLLRPAAASGAGD